MERLPADITLGQWIPLWMDSYKRGTIKGTSYHQLELLGRLIPDDLKEMPVSDIRPMQIQAFYNNFGLTASKSYMDKMRVMVNALFLTAVENGLCDRDPTRRLRAPRIAEKPREAYTMEEVRLILNYAVSCDNSRIATAVMLLLLTGLRRGELLGLQWGDISNHTLMVNRSVFLDDCMLQSCQGAEKMYSSILGILAEKLGPFTFDGAKSLFQKSRQIDFRKLAEEKTVVFLSISDTDPSNYRLANLFYTQALHTLCHIADKSPSHRLRTPVHFILDDFAANVHIPDFDRIISVIRSREISASIIIQSLSQLEALYGHAKALTILNNCDNLLYLGGQDVETASFVAQKANRRPSSILQMPLDAAWLFTRGTEPREVSKYRLQDHPLYQELPEYLPPRRVPAQQESGDAYPTPAELGFAV